MPENSNQSKKFIAALAVVLAVALAAWWFLSEKTTPPSPISTSPEPSFKSFKENMVAGNVLEISVSRKIITLGAYEIKNGKAELISRRDIVFNENTQFVRLERAADGQQKEIAITAESVKVNDVVNAFLSVASAASNPPVAQRIAILTALFPKAR